VIAGFSSSLQLPRNSGLEVVLIAGLYSGNGLEKNENPHGTTVEEPLLLVA
jgi:hypothetical protein